MGYYTSFNVAIRELNQHPVSAEEFDRADKGLRELFKSVFGEDCIGKFGESNIGRPVEDEEGGCYYIPEAKWYDCDKDMKELSANFPEVYFEVIGDGEESDDYWDTYYYQGKQQEGYVSVNISFDPDKCLNRPMYYIEGAIAMLTQGGYADIAEQVRKMRDQKKEDI